MFVLLIASFNGSTALAITCNVILNLNMFYSFRTWFSLISIILVNTEHLKFIKYF